MEEIENFINNFNLEINKEIDLRIIPYDENYDKLKQLGFVNTECIKNCDEKLKSYLYNHDISQSKLYYNEKYPNYKFVTKEMLDIITEKYNCSIISAEDYNGSFTDSMIDDLNEFKIDEDDDCYYKTYSDLIYYFRKSEIIDGLYHYKKCNFDIIVYGNFKIILKPIAFYYKKYYLVVSKI